MEICAAGVSRPLLGACRNHAWDGTMISLENVTFFPKGQVPPLLTCFGYVFIYSISNISSHLGHLSGLLGSRFTLYALDSRGGRSESSYVSVRTSCSVVDDSTAEGTGTTSDPPHFSARVSCSPFPELTLHLNTSCNHLLNKGTKFTLTSHISASLHCLNIYLCCNHIGN